MKIRKKIAISLAIAFALTAVGCGKKDSDSKSSDNTQNQTTEKITTVTEDDTSKDDSNTKENSTSDSSKDETGTSDATKDSTGTEQGTAENDILIIYFSAANMNDMDAVTSATPIINGESTVGWMASVIHEQVGGDVVKIIPSKDYPLSYSDTADTAKDEADSEARPSFIPLEVDPTSYKTVFIGYPIWWYRLPMVLETFFDTYDFSGVTIVPFNTHEGSRDCGTYDTIQEREPDSTVLEGLAMRGGNAGEDSSKEMIIDWLNGLNLE